MEQFDFFSELDGKELESLKSKGAQQEISYYWDQPTIQKSNQIFVEGGFGCGDFGFRERMVCGFSRLGRERGAPTAIPPKMSKSRPPPGKTPALRAGIA